MAQRSYFFDSVDHDRIYTTADFARVFGAIAGRDGVVYGYGNEFNVTTGTGMNVLVDTGAAFVQGRMLEVYGEAEVLAVTTADATNPRIDRVIVRLDLSVAERRAYLAVKLGTPAAEPAAPTLQQDATIWELSLAQVRVAAGATNITADDLIDERSNEEVCGWVNEPATPEGIGAVSSSEKGQSNGVATLDEDGKVPEIQLPSFETPSGAQAKVDTHEAKVAPHSGHMILGISNTDINKVKALKLQTDTRSLTLTYTSGNLTKVEEKNGATIVKTTNLTYTDGNLTKVTETAGNTTVTTTLTYTDGALTSVTKAVS